MVRVRGKSKEKQRANRGQQKTYCMFFVSLEMRGERLMNLGKEWKEDGEDNDVRLH